jgi:transposase
VLDIREMIRQLREGCSCRQVAESVGADHKTVSRYRKWAESKGWLSGAMPSAEVIYAENQRERTQMPAQNTSTVEGVGSLVQAMRKAGMEVTVIHQRLREEHEFKGSYGAIWRYVRKLEGPEAEAVLRIETAPGEEAQVDFGYAGLMWDKQSGRLRKAWFFVMTLSWSRHQFVVFVFDQRVETWLTCHRWAFEFFGGVPGRIVLNNLKAAIIKASFDDPQVQRAYRECAEHYGFVIAPCKPGKPEHKGKVENGVRYVKRNFLAGRSYRDAQHDIQQANDDVLKWIETTAGERIHGTTRQKPLLRFETVECVQLRGLPEPPFESVTWKAAKLHRDCHIVFDYAHYSAPYRLIGQTLWVRATAHKIEIYADYQLLATHTRATQKGMWTTDKTHLPQHKLLGLAETHTLSFRQRVAAIGPYTEKAIGLLLEDRVLDRRRTAGRLVALADRHSKHLLERACKRAFEHGDPSPQTIRKMIRLCLNGLIRQDADDEGNAPITPEPMPRFARTAAELIPQHVLTHVIPITPPVPVALSLN